ncbi:DUF3231 family protein [Cytobacillus purgationiresistens]|uniref:DUF3231 family protein n=1 Tax=Cytobacillus purgationiresistens TaxID=863449 RepID=A0ABU0ABR5_9BACI|nr:DUF3231 family protein [Cytobacillus purgationiresistens]MDQ0268485.1 hypothetical protein [Cytobacillus purgationiresistens]
MSKSKNNLTSAEIGCLWTSYMNDSMSVTILEFMLKHIEDKDIKPSVKFAHNMAMKHLEEIRALFRQEKYAIPEGFSENDVNMDAPWLFSDVFCLTYVNHMAKAGMVAYSGFVAMSAREDVSKYYTKGLIDTAALFNETNKIALEKGLLARHPYIEVPQETDYVESKKYYSGLNPLTSKRPLNAIEISHLYMNILTNSIGVKLCLGFAQTSPSKEIQDFMLRGSDISNKHIKVFTNFLMDNDISVPWLPDVSVSKSTTKTFSDKLMMFHMSLLSAAGKGNYSTAAAASQRMDLSVDYERLSLEIVQFAKSGADIMIKHHWLEQPPGTKNRKELAKKKS